MQDVISNEVYIKHNNSTPTWHPTTTIATMGDQHHQPPANNSTNGDSLLSHWQYQCGQPGGICTCSPLQSIAIYFGHCPTMQLNP